MSKHDSPNLPYFSVIRVLSQCTDVVIKTMLTADRGSLPEMLSKQVIL